MASMLRNTLILPENDSVLAAKLLRTAIADLDVVLMIVCGQGDEVEQVVVWADQLCNKTRVNDNFNVRRVVWVLNPATDDIQAVLRPIVGEKAPIVSVLNFHDKVVGSLSDIRKISPLRLELEFAKGHKS